MELEHSQEVSLAIVCNSRALWEFENSGIHCPSEFVGIKEHCGALQQPCAALDVAYHHWAATTVLNSIVPVEFRSVLYSLPKSANCTLTFPFMGSRCKLMDLH